MAVAGAAATMERTRAANTHVVPAQKTQRRILPSGQTGNIFHLYNFAAENALALHKDQQ